MKFWSKVPVFPKSQRKEEDEAKRQDHQDAIFNIEEMITKMNYQEGVILLQTLKEVSKSGNLLASSVVSKVTLLDSQMELYLKSTLDYDEDINSMCTELQQDMLHIT